jgi:hypothetical protein
MGTLSAHPHVCCLSWESVLPFLGRLSPQDKNNSNKLPQRLGVNHPTPARGGWLLLACVYNPQWPRGFLLHAESVHSQWLIRTLESQEDFRVEVAKNVSQSWQRGKLLPKEFLI